MDKVVITLEDNVQKEVYSIFYLYNSKYYLIYTEKQLDENGYVILHLVQVGKEINNTPNGPIDTGNMIGVEISDPNEWRLVQESITKIVENKKNGIEPSDIKYLPVSMINNLRIASKKTFRLMSNVIEDVFNLSLKDSNYISVSESNNDNLNDVQNTISNNVGSQEDVIIDYRTRFFEEQSKNEQLQAQIDSLNEKLESIKKILG